MKTITKKIDLYKFNELDKEIQEKLLDKELEEQLELYCEDCLYDDMTYTGRDLLCQTFNVSYEDAENMLQKVYYSLGYCQGDGAMICFNISIDVLNKKYNLYNEEEMRLIKDKDLITGIKVYHDNGLYYHEYTFNIDYNDNFGYYDYEEDIKDNYEVSEEEYKEMENKIVDLLDAYNKFKTESKFVEDIIDINGKLASMGYNMIEDKDAFMEIAMDYLNEREYTKNGEIYYE